MRMLPLIVVGLGFLVLASAVFTRRVKWSAVWVGLFINVVFWVIYSLTDNVVSSMGITAGVTIILAGVLYMLGQIDKRKQKG